MTYDSIQHRGRGKFRSKSQRRGRSASGMKSCKYCGKSHNRGNCPAYGKKCQKCGKENHFKAVVSLVKGKGIIEISVNPGKRRQRKEIS